MIVTPPVTKKGSADLLEDQVKFFIEELFFLSPKGEAEGRLIGKFLIIFITLLICHQMLDVTFLFIIYF